MMTMNWVHGANGGVAHSKPPSLNRAVNSFVHIWVFTIGNLTVLVAYLWTFRLFSTFFPFTNPLATRTWLFYLPPLLYFAQRVVCHMFHQVLLAEPIYWIFVHCWCFCFLGYFAAGWSTYVSRTISWRNGHNERKYEVVKAKETSLIPNFF